MGNDSKFFRGIPSFLTSHSNSYNYLKNNEYDISFHKPTNLTSIYCKIKTNLTLNMCQQVGV